MRGAARRAVLLVAVALAVLVLGAAATGSDNQLVCTPASLAICRPVALPDGYHTLPCDEPDAVCGVAINTMRRSPCSQQEAAAATRTANICGCISRLQQALNKAPALIRPGVPRGPERYPGAVKQDLLAGEPGGVDGG